MRTIKFKGKDVNTDEWLYGDLAKCNGDTFIATYNEVEPTYTYTTEDIHINKVIPETVCQFVMRHEGNDIYEHDLIRYLVFLCEVVFDEKIGAFCLLYLRSQTLGRIPLGEELRLSGYELEGNIFDNK
jgi:hypothetical protein